MRLAQIVIDAAAAQVRAAQAEVDGVLLRDDADVLGAVDEDAVAREQRVHFVDDRHDFLEELLQAA